MDSNYLKYSEPAHGKDEKSSSTSEDKWRHYYVKVTSSCYVASHRNQELLDFFNKQAEIYYLCEDGIENSVPGDHFFKNRQASRFQTVILRMYSITA